MTESPTPDSFLPFYSFCTTPSAASRLHQLALQQYIEARRIVLGEGGLVELDDCNMGLRGQLEALGYCVESFTACKTCSTPFFLSSKE